MSGRCPVLLLLSIQNEPEWKGFREAVLERPDLVDDPRFRTGMKRVENRPSLNAAIEAVFTSLSSQEIAARLRRANIAFSRLNSVEEFARHPQLRLTRVDTPGGHIDLPGELVAWIGREGDRRTRTPDVGEHSEAIRKDFGAG